MASSAGGPPPFNTKRAVDLAFAMDCTGSMGSYIKQAQENVRKIAEEIVKREKVDLRLALVEYRDHPPQETTYVTNVLDFTESLSKMKARLDLCEAKGGGDTPEAVADALHDVYKLSWRDSVTKICVFIADAPPHGLNCPEDAFKDGCPSGLDPMVTAYQLAAKEIIVYTVGCEPSIIEYRDWFMAISHITGGQYVPLGSAQLLSQVIIGGTVEEISLSGFMGDVTAEVSKLTLSGKSAEEIEKLVYEKLKGSKTKQVRTEAGALMEPTAQAKRIAEQRNMEKVRLIFKPTPVINEQATLAAPGFLRESRVRSAAFAASADRDVYSTSPSMPAGDTVAAYEVADTEITEYQISRLVNRSLHSTSKVVANPGIKFEKLP